MAVIGTVLYHEHCVKQGRDGIKPLTRKQKKALRQHKADTNKRVGVSSFKANNSLWLNVETGRFE